MSHFFLKRENKILKGLHMTLIANSVVLIVEDNQQVRYDHEEERVHSYDIVQG